MDNQLLSMATRLQLVQLVIQAMLLHSFSIYQWPCSLLRKLFGWIRNFVWIGSNNTTMIVTISQSWLCYLFLLNHAAFLLLLSNWSNFQLYFVLENGKIILVKEPSLPLNDDQQTKKMKFRAQEMMAIILSIFPLKTS